MNPKIDYTLYFVTDREIMTSNSIEECVKQAILGGYMVVQLKEKTASSREFYETALKVREITNRLNVPLIIDDRVDITSAVDADGIHLGQNYLTYEVVRKNIDENKIIGISASSLKEAITAAEAGADYLGVGAMFTTDTKKDVNYVTMDELRKIREKVSIPIVVIGGISKKTIPLFKGTGVDGIAYSFCYCFTK
ncbi:MAG: thiamine phosphate synthase [Candidatus Paraimprobicoccus trichonymphae]|uniref:Thiamine-phosphate synthase n=1 Tax=Candidatus Paraimprobicoccus trichonymphae TaxID=3033793 RepID=A0AA48ICL5_9FIRM|nr:MAG: thiamine phosphate synthase [Candidatus Paraimprobicoccus trichonymphae]